MTGFPASIVKLIKHLAKKCKVSLNGTIHRGGGDFVDKFHCFTKFDGAFANICEDETLTCHITLNMTPDKDEKSFSVGIQKSEVEEVVFAYVSDIIILESENLPTDIKEKLLRKKFAEIEELDNIPQEMIEELKNLINK
jgi:hypothetical protein